MVRLSLGLGRDNTRIFLGMIFNEGGLGIYQTLWPIYIASLGASPPQIGLVIGLLGLCRLVFLIPSGMLSDRLPPRTLIVSARLVAAFGTFLLGLAQSWWHLIPGVFILSAGTIAFPALSSTIAERAGNGWARTRAFTLIYTVGPSAAYLITPTLGGFIAQHVSLRALLFISAGLTATGAAIFSTIERGSVSSHDGPPVTYRSALVERPIRLVLMLMFATIFVLTMGVTLAPNFLQEVHSISIEHIGWLGSGAAIGSAMLGLLINRVGPLRRPLAGIALGITAVAGMLGLLLVGRGFLWFAVAYLLRGGFMLAWSTFYAALGEVSSERLRGRVYALAELLAGAGMAAAPFVAGWLYGWRPQAPMVASLLTIPLLLLAIATVARLLRTEQPSEPALVEEHV